MAELHKVNSRRATDLLLRLMAKGCEPALHYRRVVGYHVFKPATVAELARITEYLAAETGLQVTVTILEDTISLLHQATPHPAI